MARRSRTFVRAGSKQRRTKWCGSGLVSDNVGFGLSRDVICPVTEFDEFTGPTIVRIRGNVYLSMGIEDGGQAQGVEASLGIMVLDVEVGTPPDPASANDADRSWLWLYSGRFVSRGERVVTWDSSGAVVLTSPQIAVLAGDHFVRLEIDIKAMRKVKPGEELVLVRRTSNVAAGTPTFRRLFNLRALVKE